MREITARELRRLNTEQLQEMIPFFILRDGERVALVIDPNRYHIYTRIRDLVDPAGKAKEEADSGTS